MNLSKTWIIKEKTPKDIIKSLLKNRNITNVQEFFDPPLPESFSLHDVGIDELQVKKAIKRINLAKGDDECVVIYGDYDVDGTCATSLLWHTLNKLKLKVFPFIPDRFTEGYGMSQMGIDKIVAQYPKTSLIIAVDNGIVAHEAISYAEEKGIDVIVCDHHEKNGENKAFSIIHTTQLCGTAVAWFLCKELGEKSGLDLVSIATVSDQMKLLGINRSLVYHGLKTLRKTTNVGLLALCDAAGILASKIGTYEIGFVLGPRINAAGRISNALDIVRLLCTNNRQKAQNIAFELNSLNIKRQGILKETIDLARLQIDHSQKFIIVSGEFHEGVIGLAAGRIVEETGKPTLVLSRNEEGFKGSARSVSGFHVTDALNRFSNLLKSVGGHEMAAGLTILNENLDEFLKAFSDYTNKEITDELLKRKLTVDCEISLTETTEQLCDTISKMEPFGLGNPRPMFVSENLVVKNLKIMGQKKEHLKLTLSSEGCDRDALIFNAGDSISNFSKGQKVSVVYSIDKNVWNDRTNVQLMLKDYIIYHEKGKRKIRRSISNSSRKLKTKSK